MQIFQDITLHIFKCLPLKDIHSLGLVNREFHKGYSNELNWKEILERDFADDYDTSMGTTNCNIYQYSCKIKKLNNVLRLNKPNKKIIAMNEIQAQFIQLQSVLPEIGLLVNVRTLWLNTNRLEFLPPEIGSLINLETFYLTNNKLKSLPAEIGLLSKLKMLDLHNNRLKNLPPEMGLLTDLESLYLGCNNLEYLPVEMKLLTKLECLDLDKEMEIGGKLLLPNIDIKFIS